MDPSSKEVWTRWTGGQSRLFKLRGAGHTAPPRGSWIGRKDRGMTFVVSATGCGFPFFPVHGNLLSLEGRAKDVVISCKCGGHRVLSTAFQIHSITRPIISSSIVHGHGHSCRQPLLADAVCSERKDCRQMPTPNPSVRRKAKAKGSSLIS